VPIDPFRDFGFYRVGQQLASSLPKDVAEQVFRSDPGNVNVDPLRSFMVAYSWAKGFLSKTISTQARRPFQPPLIHDFRLVKAPQR
jgi:hypothetical protein